MIMMMMMMMMILKVKKMMMMMMMMPKKKKKKKMKMMMMITFHTNLPSNRGTQLYYSNEHALKPSVPLLMLRTIHNNQH